MKIITLIIGKNSNLTIELQKKIENSISISARELCNKKSLLEEFISSNINIIFNNFQPASSIKSIENYSQYITNSILTTSIVLEKLKDAKINKIIYTSSSSVYGNNNFCEEENDLNPLNLHGSLKLANEKLIEIFCIKKNIDYTIARVFNMYGGNDNFSIISKLIKAYKNQSTLTLINGGDSIRDYIHIEDVVDIYVKLLKTKNIRILNVGTGNAISVKQIINYFKTKQKSIKIDSIESDEIKISTASTKNMNVQLGDKKFYNIYKYIENEINN